MLLLTLMAAGAFALGLRAQVGNVCGTPKVITSLPYNDAGNTSSYGDDYDTGDVPAVAPGAVTNGTGSTYYITGDDVVYAYTPTVDQGVTISTTNYDDYIGLWAFTGCPFSSTVGYHTATSGATRSIPNLTLTGGTTYYFVISTWPSPQSTDYTINVVQDWISALPCTGTPTAGTLPSNVPVCLGSTTTLEPTGALLELNLTYLWEESADGSSWAAATGTNNEATYTTPPFSVPMYYRQVVTCTNSSESDTTNVAATSLFSTPAYYLFDGISYTQDFESWTDRCSTADSPGASWLNTPASGLNSWRRDGQHATAGWTAPSTVFTPAGSSGAHSARFHSIEAPATPDPNSQGRLDLYLDMTLAGGNTKLKFDYINPTPQSGTNTDVIDVRISTDGGATFTNLGTNLGQADTWATQEYTITSNSATTILRFRGTSDLGGSDIGLDNIRIFTPCTTPPTAVASAAEAEICEGSSTVISATNIGNLGGITLQWEQSNDGSTGWTPISGATTATYTTPALSVARYFRLVQSCSYGSSSSTSNTVAVTMAAPVYATYDGISFSETFENWSNNCDSLDAPATYWRNTPATGNNSWRRDDQGGSANWSSNSGTYAASTSKSARFHTYNSSSGLQGNLDLYIDMSAASGPTRLNFDHINTSGTDVLRVFYSTDGGSNFNQIGDNFGIAATWTNRTLDFSSNSATTVLRLQATSDAGTTDIGIDSLFLAPSPSCLPPTDFSAHTTAPDGATLAWEASLSNPGVGYYWEVRDAGNAVVQSGTEGTSATSAAVSGLTEGTTYTARMRTVCAVGDSSAWTGTVSFTAGTVQIGTGATNASNFPISSCSAYNYTQQIYLAAEYNGGTYINKVRFKHISSGTPFNTWKNWTVYMGNTSKSSFSSTTDWVPRNQLVQVFNDTVAPVAGQWMEISLNPGFLWDGTSNIVVAVDENTAGTSCTATWSSFTATGTNRGMYVRGTTDQNPSSPGSGTRSNILAQVQFGMGVPPSCLPPTLLQASNITTIGADLSWTASASNPANGYLWEVRTTGAPGNPGSAAASGSTAAGVTTANATGLSAQTTYYLYVRSTCTSPDTSTWAGPMGFTTPCTTVNIPYTENFASPTVPALPACMTQVQGNPSDKPWETSNTAAAGMT
ncbi:MAG TPA: fibronectin type III domain-containing protein, partial [Flavobacteriales bacterium]|nr:fibronectin type III domain-containing protein [Flavobacteriales bacterium]